MREEILHTHTGEYVYIGLTQRREESFSRSFKLFPDLDKFTGQGWVLPAGDTVISVRVGRWSGYGHAGRSPFSFTRKLSLSVWDFKSVLRISVLYLEYLLSEVLWL